MWNALDTRPAAWNVLIAYALARFHSAVTLCPGDACNMAITVDNDVRYSISIVDTTGLLDCISTGEDRFPNNLTTFTSNAAAHWLSLIKLPTRRA